MLATLSAHGFRTFALTLVLGARLFANPGAASGQSKQPVVILHAFLGTNGTAPNSLIEGHYHALYGTTLSGGANGTGSVFKISSNGAFTSLYSFGALNNTANGDGANPVKVVSDPTSNVWGIASAGGLSGRGTVFTITSTGFHLVHSFTLGGGDGVTPSALMAARDGSLYGMTEYGGNGK